MTDYEALIREARERAKSLAWLGGGGNQEAHVDADLLRDSARKMSALADALEATTGAMKADEERVRAAEDRVWPSWALKERSHE